MGSKKKKEKVRLWQYEYDSSFRIHFFIMQSGKNRSMRFHFNTKIFRDSLLKLLLLYLSLQIKSKQIYFKQQQIQYKHYFELGATLLLKNDKIQNEDEFKQFEQLSIKFVTFLQKYRENSVYLLRLFNMLLTHLKK
ncbi:unnamed protein product [Paramecium sonneborni]|uniref:Uncharacterized protein n=1 Tax=Paramecium sonneborni TaxID=65129 RepID=A0A8S1M6I9_9CILI|nr:unnamed protein product [Paramecium sonneborni]